MKIAYRCMSNPEHKFVGNNLDGVRCWCGGLVMPYEVDKEEYKTLPKYREIMKGRKNKLVIPLNVFITLDGRVIGDCFNKVGE